MKFTPRPASLAKLTADAVVVGIQTAAKDALKLSPSAEQLKADGSLADALALGDVSGAVGKTTLVLAKRAKGAPLRIVLVGLGAEGKLDAKAFAKASAAALQAVAATGAQSCVFTLNEMDVTGADAVAKARLAASTALEVTYRYDATKSKKDPAVKLNALALPAEGADAKAVQHGLAEGDAIGQGQSLARTLGNLPANVCTPTHLADTARDLAKDHDLEVQVLDRKQCEALKMGSFLSVARGSDEPPKFIVLKYNGAGKAAPVVLVGKGITFDSGGISLKPGEGMDEMKFDMCGAASVLGTFKTLGLLKPKLNVVGLIPTCENMPSGRALKPGDIITSMSGQTVEILNTDAEGRLILNDALTYAKRFKPAAVVDIATLTGACVIALGHIHSGLYANNEGLAGELLAAGTASNDTAWRMPLDDDYQEGLKSNFADMANIAGRPGGSITAACFLSRYVDGYDWAHLDVAGTAWHSGKHKGSTGRPVPLLTHFLLARAGK